MKNFLWYILLISISLFSQNVVFEVDTNRLRIGERFNLSVKSYDIDSSSVFWSQLDTMFYDFEILNKPILQTSSEEDSFIYKRFLLTAFDTGSFLLPSTTFLSYHNDSIQSNSISVDFFAVELDSTDKIFDVKPIKKIPFLIKELGQYVPQIFLLLLLLLVWIYALLKYYNKDPFLTSLEPEIPIDEHYLNELTQLESENYLNQKDFQSYYTRLSEIYRGYLEGRFNIPALESDTYDLKILLASKNLDKNWFNSFFRNCDLVKFAKGTPELDISVEFLDHIKIYIKEYGVNSDEQIQLEEKRIILKEVDMKRDKIKKKIYTVLIFVVPVLMIYLIYKFLK